MLADAAGIAYWAERLERALRDAITGDGRCFDPVHPNAPCSFRRTFHGRKTRTELEAALSGGWLRICALAPTCRTST
jgi:hypothetical protein